MPITTKEDRDELTEHIRRRGSETGLERWKMIYSDLENAEEKLATVHRMLFDNERSDEEKIHDLQKLMELHVR